MMESIPRGFYVADLNKTTFVIPTRYYELSPLGEGAFGCVCAAEDKETGNSVAIKKLSRPFQSAIHAKRTYRELIFLRHMKHENIINLLHAFTPNTQSELLSEVYFVTQAWGTDLCNLLKIQRLTDDHVQFLVYQILRGLKYLHSVGLVHRDLKPSNMSINEDCELKILDFGLARQTDDEMTGYVATRWYRAPEVIFNWMHYTNAIDIWSVGCILAELITGKTVFPGSDHINQLNRIMRVVGTPGPELMAKIQSTEAKDYIMSLPKTTKQDFNKVFAGASSVAIDLLERMLLLDPELRITAAQALAHPYLESYHDDEDEPEATPIPDTEKTSSLDELRVLIWEELEDIKREHSLESSKMGSKRRATAPLAQNPPPKKGDPSPPPPPSADAWKNPPFTQP